MTREDGKEMNSRRKLKIDGLRGLRRSKVKEV
jgi:hypothetical protein